MSRHRAPSVRFRHPGIRTLASAALAAALLGEPLLARAQAPEAGVEQVLQAWVGAFNACEVAKISALYDDRVLMWGTTARSLIVDGAGVRRYFEAACASPVRLQVALGEAQSRVQGDSAVSAGVLVFRRGTSDLPVRFGFALSRRDGQWRIVHHHTSPLPPG